MLTSQSRLESRRHVPRLVPPALVRPPPVAAAKSPQPGVRVAASVQQPAAPLPRLPQMATPVCLGLARRGPQPADIRTRGSMVLATNGPATAKETGILGRARRGHSPRLPRRVRILPECPRAQATRPDDTRDPPCSLRLSRRRPARRRPNSKPTATWSDRNLAPDQQLDSTGAVRSPAHSTGAVRSPARQHRGRPITSSTAPGVGVGPSWRAPAPEAAPIPQKAPLRS